MNNPSASKLGRYLSSGRLLAILAIAAFACVIGIMLLPQFSIYLFILICVFGYLSIYAYRGSFSPLAPADKKTKRIIINKRDDQMLRSITDALQHPAFILDQDAKVVYSNAKGLETFDGIQTGEWLFLKFRQPDLRRTIENGLRSAVPMTTSYNEAVPKRRWFSVEVSPIPHEMEQVGVKEKLFLLSFHDLTEVKRVDQMRSDFIANASHELRTPLASLLGYLETIKGPARKDEAALERFTDVMLDQAQRMTRLVNDLLSLSRIEMKSHVRPAETVNLTEILKSVVVSLEGMAEQLGVEIKFTAKESVSVIGDRDELLQVFENLVENACKYGQEGKRVIVSLEKQEDLAQPCAIVTVQDFGPGIALEDQQRITERFYRVDVARSREKQGTGLGLAIVKHILNRHGTRLNIKSVPDEGASFSVRLNMVSSVKKQ